MKNLFRNLAFCALVAGTFTACHKGDSVDPEAQADKTVDHVVFTTTNTLVVRSNVDATFTFAGQTQTGTEATFETTAKTGNLKVTATGKRDVEKKVSFAKTDYQVLEVSLVAAGKVVLKSDAEVDGVDVTNGDANRDDNDGVEASFNVGGNDSNVNGDYSVTVFTPEDVETNTDAITTNTEANEPVLALDCQPDGAAFTNPITMTVKIPGSEGFDIDCVNAAKASDKAIVAVDPVDGTKRNFTLDHFSIWDIVLNATGTMTKSTQTITADGDAGTGSLTYKFDYGFETQSPSTLVNKYLKKLFGIAKRESSKSIKFTAVQGGTAKLTATQEVKTYKFVSGTGANKQEFTATVYGKVTVNNLSITAPAPVAPTIKTHSGGASDL